MIEYLISLFIDDEMNLDEKVTFVETVRSNDQFAEETLSLLDQEKFLRSDVVDIVPPVILPEKKSALSFLRKHLTVYLGSAAVAAALIFLFFITGPLMETGDGTLNRVPYRFVIYRPDAQQAEIVGSFTGWKAVQMNPVDDYWQITLELPVGEHRFSYIIDGKRQVSDPTIPIREKDDFGGENSILEVQWSV